MSDVPRGPLYYEDDLKAVDMSSGYARSIITWMETATEEATKTARLNPEYNNVPKYIKYLSGNQWQSDIPRPVYKSKFYINKLGKSRLDELALLTDPQPDIELYSNSDDLGLNEQAKMVGNVIKYEWQRQNMDMSLITAVDIALACGTSFWKIGAQSPGSFKITPCGPDSVMPIQPGFHIQESTAVMYRAYKRLNDIRRRFPFNSANLEQEAASSDMGAVTYGRPPHIDKWTWDGLSPQMKRAIGRKSGMDPVEDVFKVVEYKEFYVEDMSVNESKKTIVMKDPWLGTSEHSWWYKVEPGQRLYPRKRLLIYAGKRLMYDGPSPYFHGLYPFATMRLNPVFWSFWGLSKYRDLIPLNTAMNDIVSGILDMIKKALNPVAITKAGAVSEATWREFFPDMPGAKLFMSNLGQPSSDIRYMDPPKLESYVIDLLAKFLSPEFDKMSGVLDVSSLGGKMQVPGGDTIEQMRDAMQNILRLEDRYITTFLRDAGVQAMSNVFQFYTMRQRMRILGADGVSFSDFMLDHEKLTPAAGNKFDHWKNFSFSIRPGSMNPGAKDRDKQVAMSLFQMGALSRETLLSTLGVSDTGEIMPEQQGGAPRLTRGQRNGQPV